MTRFVADTNFFLQCKVPEELPWRDHWEDSIEILVPRVVQKEIDRLKGDGNGRRAQRARRAAKILRDAAVAATSRVVLRDANPSIVLSLIRRSTDFAFPSTLDPEYPDDAIVVDALAAAANGAPALVLTSDAGIIQTARAHDLPFFVIPDEWLLPPEPDRAQKELEALRRRVDALERDTPTMSMRFLDHDGEPIHELVITLIRFENADTASIAFRDRAAKQHPMANDYGLSPPWIPPAYDMTGREWQGPSSEEIQRYREKAYPEWLDSTRGAFARYIYMLEKQSWGVDFLVEVRNEGNAPALNVLLTLSTLVDDLTVVADPGDEPVKIDLPSPPRPPTGGWRGGMRGMLRGLEVADPILVRDFTKALVPAPRDRYAFSELPSQSGGVRVACDELRHREKAHRLAFRLTLVNDTAVGGRARVTLSATNAVDGIQLELPVTVRRETRDALPLADNLAVSVEPNESI